MLRRLKRGEASCVVIHKVDRSARNLKDWSTIGELLDRNIDVYFAAEAVDLRSRSGRLSADMLAVIAADYIRNLREEIRKGIDGRLKQGIYPFGAPIGYLNRGRGGKLKELDPVRAPAVRKAFELYATGNYTLHTLLAELHRSGLRNVRGGRISIEGISTILNNPFYIGVLRVKGKTYLGKHQPLISHALFERVSLVLRGLTNTRILRHDYLFRRRFACGVCRRSLIASRHKGHVYYRCQTVSCPTTVVREEALLAAVRQQLGTITFTSEQINDLRTEAERLIASESIDLGQETARIQAAIGDLTARLNRLVDAFVAGDVDKDIYEERKTAFIMERARLDHSLELVRNSPQTTTKALQIIVERAANALEQFETCESLSQKRQLLDLLTSNRVVNGKIVELTLEKPYRELAEQANFDRCAPKPNVPRTTEGIVKRLWLWLAAHPLEAEKIVIETEVDEQTSADSR